MGEQRRQLRVANGADNRRQQPEAVHLERVHRRHYPSAQADDHLFRRQLERPANGQHTSPAPGAAITLGQSFTLTASASDSDGTVTKVDFFANGVPIGTDRQHRIRSPGPRLPPVAIRTAVATDNGLATTTSSPVSVTVNPVGTGTTVVLQRGLNGYAGVSDTYLDNFLRTTVRGGLTPLLLDPINYNPLLRFAIFQSEGGPVPNGATILSATLALYKQLYNDTLRLNALLKPWSESQATWTISQTGVPWTVGGAAGAGTDYSTTTDALVTPSWNPGWVSFDMTPRVQQWASSGANYGWRMAQSTGGINSKQFTSSEYTADTTLRPKLTIIYSGGSSNVPPTVSITSPAPGAAITLGQSFTLTASASDSDGTVTKVDFFANGVPIGTDTTAPYSITWTPAATGSYSLTAVATDNGLATTTSSPVSVTVNPVGTGTTVVLQRGLNGYAGVSDTYLDNFLRTTVRGGLTPLLLDPINYNPLLRFAIFQSEGGPVPNGATILSATLALYKQLYNDTLRLNALLKPWVGEPGDVDDQPDRRAVDRGRCRRCRHRLQHHDRCARHAQLEPWLGQLRHDPPRAAVGEQRRQLRMAHGAVNRRHQLQAVHLERVHRRHYPSAQADDHLFRRQLERPANGQHYEPGTGCGDHARPELHAHRQRQRFRRHRHQGRLLCQWRANWNGYDSTVFDHLDPGCHR